MKIYTSYFGNLRKLPKTFTFLSIAGKTPIWFENAKLENYKKFRKLAPLYSWWKEWHDKFEGNLDSYESKSWYCNKYYETILDKLNVKDIYDEFIALSDNNDICLLCYETPEKFCHRHIVAEWLNNYGIKTDEYK